MLIKLHQQLTIDRNATQVVDCLKKGGVIIYPTDTVYSLGCDLYNTKALERICQIKGIKLSKANFSFVCFDLSNLSAFTLPIYNSTYKLMKQVLPGPYTFILNANNQVPKLFKSKKKTVGIRVPDNLIPRLLVNELGNPIVSTSIHDDDAVLEYTTDPELIYEKYQNQVDMVIDGGYGGNVPSTVIDCTSDEPVIIRQGKGELQFEFTS